MIRKINELSPEEVLALAIQVEQANAVRLRRYAKAFEPFNGEAALKFRELAEEEDRHEDWLTQKFKRRFNGPLPIITEFDVEGMMDFIEWDLSEFENSGELGAEQIYRLALDAENRARRFYQEAETITEDPSVALLFRQLAGMEDDHVGWLEERILDVQEEKEA